MKSRQRGGSNLSDDVATLFPVAIMAAAASLFSAKRLVASDGGGQLAACVIIDSSKQGVQYERRKEMDRRRLLACVEACEIRRGGKRGGSHSGRQACQMVTDWPCKEGRKKPRLRNPFRKPEAGISEELEKQAGRRREVSEATGGREGEAVSL